MHELSIMTHLLDTVELEAQRAGATRICAVNLVVGERTSFIDDSLLFYFDTLTVGRMSEGAQLHIRRTPMRFHCATCDQEYSPGGAHFRCPRCDKPGQLTSDGSELLIESMEIET
jgi:hydrogenase nickel incorporation protein HypA/HybF